MLNTTNKITLGICFAIACRAAYQTQNRPVEPCRRIGERINGLPVDEGGVEALLERTRRKPNTANRVDEITEQAVITSAVEVPTYGQARTSNELRKVGVFVSPSGVRSVWLRHDLANFKHRLKGLEAKIANDNGIILTEAQVQALEKKKHDDEACGEIETSHPGYLGSQDTFYVGTLIRCGTGLPANLCRHLVQGRPCQTLRHKDTDHSR